MMNHLHQPDIMLLNELMDAMILKYKGNFITFISRISASIDARVTTWPLIASCS